MIKLQHEPIDIATILQAVKDPRAGGIAFFIGSVRQFTGGRTVSALVFEAAGEMAEQEMKRIVAEAERQFGLVRGALVHRVGMLPVGEIIVVAAASAPHRKAAFDAVMWMVDELKRTVPIWKKELYEDGQAAWIHPGWEDPPEG
ncbi:MAG: molybdenum cofactor biosynthesis protein MoaE [Thermoguttaceae bacterium]|nr:molybdenum cofactor biosynthesis protein MoaE [Thermoguttaceae bacterium]MDW8078678.1 molybdenum cofactor biosynthesis protein MoaE [Thermoguttaceae bacterium]